MAIDSPSSAQDPAGVSTLPDVSVASVEDQLKRAEAATELDEDAKKKTAELLRQALDQAKRTESFTSQRVGFESAAKTVDDRAAALKQRAKDFKEDQPPKIDASAALPALEQQLGQVEQLAKDLREKVVKADTEIATRAARIKTARARLVEAKRQLDELTTQGGVAVGDADTLESAKTTESITQQQLLRAEIPALEAELSLLDAESVADLPRLRRDDAALELAATEKLLQALQVAVRARRAAEASMQIETTKSEAKKETNQLLRALALRNVELAQRYQVTNDLIAGAEKKLKMARAFRDDWMKEAASTKNQVETIGLTNTTGTMLRQQKLQLPNPKTYQANVRERSPLVDDAQLAWLRFEEERSRDLAETIRRSDELMEPTSSDVRADAMKLIDKRNELLAPLTRAQNDYFLTLVELSNLEQQFANEISEYESFIDERVLWVRSNASMLSSLTFDKGDLWLLDAGRWNDAAQSIWRDLRHNIIWYGVAAITLVILLRNRLLFRARIREYGQIAESRSCTLFSPTVRTIILTFVAAVPWPALFAFAGWRLSLIAGNNEALRALAHGFQCVSVVYFPLECFRLVCRPHGLAEAHFGWPSQSVQLLRYHIRAAMVISMPLILLTAMLSSSTDGVGADTVERLTFIVVTIALSSFLGRVLHPRTGAFSGYLAQHAGGWVHRLQPIWYWLICLSPLALAGLTFFGYYYTAQQLSWRLYATVCQLGCVLIATAFISRLLLVQRRRLSIEQARQRRAAASQVSQDDSGSIAVDELPNAEDLRAQISQSQSLLRAIMVGVALTGIWFAWVDVLPALEFLEQSPLWSSTQQKSEMVTSDAGVVSFVTREVPDPVTIADVVLSIVILLLTLVSARNIPGVLEISILQRLPIEASVRYAITTLVSYAIMLVGLIVACGMIGIHWNQVQWMATALTFGLAFGLQEMFANFVAGIIILFERPIRVGDIVTIDDVSGTVSRVNIRATTITNWDRKDYVVPNKDFITGRVLNWTLSDQFNRIVINVGVAYGSDTTKTLEQIKKVADEHPLIVDEPAPSVTFEEFGASSLNFGLRCYISLKDMPSRLLVIHQLHMAIDEAFRKSNIEIAFPQQDIHIRSTPKDKSLNESLHGNGSTPEKPKQKGRNVQS